MTITELKRNFLTTSCSRRILILIFGLKYLLQFLIIFMITKLLFMTDLLVLQKRTG